MFKMKNETSSNFFKDTNATMSRNMNRINSASVVPTKIAKFNTHQSPKIISGKIRENTYQKIPFSNLDVPIGKIARGTKLAGQYDRREENELKLLMNQTVGNFNFRPLKIKIEEEKNKENPNQNDEEKNDYIKTSMAMDRNVRTANFPTTNNFRTKIISESRNTKNLILNDVTTQINMNTTTDKWKPNNYKEYERLVKTAHSKRKQQDSNLPFYSTQELKIKNYESDIFFINKNEKNSDNLDKIKKLKTNAIDSQDSDIFMIKNNKTAIDKNGEKYLNGNRKATIFNVSSKSNSEWEPKNSYPSLLNHSSTNYHILNPALHNISKTREQIIKESDSFNPVNRQKSLCEFIDLTRVGVPNPNKEFLSALKKAPNAFHRDSNVCATFMDIHKMYKDLSDKPFVKKII